MLSMGATFSVCLQWALLRVKDCSRVKSLHGGISLMVAVLALTGCASNGGVVGGASQPTVQSGTTGTSEVNPKIEEGPGINLSAFFRNPEGSLTPSPVVDDAEYAEYLEWKRWQEFKAYLEWQRQRQPD